MASLNEVVLLGNLTRNPELRSVPVTNKPIARCGIAVNRKVKDKEEVMFIDIVAFGRIAEIMGEYLTKGAMVCISGRLNYSQWESNGQKHSKHEVYIEKLQMVGGKYGKEVSEKANEVVGSD